MPPKSIYREEVPKILHKIKGGIQELVEKEGPSETVYVLEYIADKLSQHKGEYIRLPKVDPTLLDKVNVKFIRELLESDEENHGLFHHMVTDHSVRARFSEMVTSIEDDT